VRSWPVVVTVVDLVWGALLTGMVSMLGLWSARFLK
jgi:uncharacterized membrane protein